MLVLGIFRDLTFSASNVMTLLVYGALGAQGFFVTIQLQTVSGYGALAAGAAFVPTTLVMLVLASRGGRLGMRIGPRIPMTFGPLVIAAGVLLMLLIGPDVVYVRDVLPGAIVFGLGLSLMIAPLTATVLAAAPDEHAGIASGVNNAVARAGALLAVAALPVAVGLHGDGVRRPGRVRRRLPDGHDDLRGAARGRRRGVVADHPAARCWNRTTNRPPRLSTGASARTRVEHVGAHHETGCTMRNKSQATATMVRLLENARYEVLPTASIEDDDPRARRHRHDAHRHRLAQQGARGHPRPDRAAHRARLHRRPAPGRADGPRPRRAVRDLRPADRQAGSTRIFVPGGDADQPGGYPDALSMLEDLAELGRPFAHVGITGYPESHPTISDDLTIQSMWDKRRFATHVVSNLTFDPEVLATWVRPDAGRGITMPLLLGHPRSRRPDQAARRWPPRSASASPPGSWPSTRAPSPASPHPVASPASGSWRRSRPALSPPEMLVEGLHVFTFNQVPATERVAARRCSSGSRAKV